MTCDIFNVAILEIVKKGTVFCPLRKDKKEKGAFLYLQKKEVETLAVKSVKNTKKRHKIGLALAVIQLILTVLCMGFICVLDLLSPVLIGAIGVVLLLVWLIVFLTQFTKKMHIGGKVLSILMCVVLAIGVHAMVKANSLLGNITDSEYKIDKMVVIVMNNDPAEEMKDAVSYQFGMQNVQSGSEGEKAYKAVEQLNDDYDTELSVEEYESMDALVEALYDGNVQAIVMNEALRSTIEDHFETFTDDTRILETIEFKTKVKKAKNIDVTKETFNVYISGIDVFGDISTNSRSDVNIIATINPTTKQILLTTTPRDYYVEIPGVSGGSKDKLTHAGIYGVDTSMNTLSELYGGIDIDYYVRVNFSGVQDIIDAIGGITVYSKYSFSTWLSPHYHYDKGYNDMNGAEALWFARDRKNVPGGERQRGKNQQQVIKGIINKVTSPSVLANYSEIMEAISGCVQTNMKDDQLKSLVKMQLSDGAEWNVVSLAADGTGTRGYCYSYTGKSLYVMEPNYNTISYIENVMQKVMDGETLTEEDENGIESSND